MIYKINAAYFHPNFAFDLCITNKLLAINFLLFQDNKFNLKN